MVSRDGIGVYAQIVDGLRLPAFLGGHPALDFCNTRAGWGEPGPREYLETYDHLVVWARKAGLVEPRAAAALRAVRAAEAVRVLERALALREAFYGVATRTDDAGARAVAPEVEAAAAAASLTIEAGRAAWKLPIAPELPVLAVARSMGEFLTSDDARHVGRCAGDGCGWLFLDPRGRRRWCTMAVCGNRAKVRRHAERHRPAPPRSRA